MKDIDILKQEEELCNRIWAENYREEVENGKKYANLNHLHICDFELINFKYCKNKKELNKLVEKKCKEYLSSIGEKRDKYMDCCDQCLHDRYITISSDNPDLVLNICTLGLENEKYPTKGLEYLK